jgi:phosphate transport system protein
MTRTLRDKELQELHTQMMQLHALVEHALAEALQALEMGDRAKASAVITADNTIKELKRAIQERTFRSFMLQQPLAGRDLRYLTSLLPITIDLERIGDEAKGIAQIILPMVPFEEEQSQELDSLQQTQGTNGAIGSVVEVDQFTGASLMHYLLNLGQQVQQLLQRTMKAFANRDARAARYLWQEDLLVDRHYYSVRRELMATLEGVNAIPALQRDPYMMLRVTYLLWVAHELERIADHCTDICERIVFTIEGEMDIGVPLD